MGVDCDYVAKGENMDELMKDAMNHAKEAHPEKYQEMMNMSEEDKQKMMKEVEAKVMKG
jgi:predicted small metal-binding protein